MSHICMSILLCVIKIWQQRARVALSNALSQLLTSPQPCVAKWHQRNPPPPPVCVGVLVLFRLGFPATGCAARPLLQMACPAGCKRPLLLRTGASCESQNTDHTKNASHMPDHNLNTPSVKMSKNGAQAHLTIGDITLFAPPGGRGCPIEVREAQRMQQVLTASILSSVPEQRALNHL